MKPVSFRIARRYAVLAGFFPVLSPLYAQTVRYVDADTPASGNGLSWATAHRHLQDALTAAQSGDEVWVAAGTYRPDETAANPTGTGDRTATFQLINGATLYGGFAGGQTSLLQRDPAANPTILSGDLSANDVENEFPGGPTYTDNAYHVVSGTGTASAAILDGFTIRGGNANGAFPTDRGGGMLVDNGGGVDPEIRNCTFTFNSTSSYGGGVSHRRLSGAAPGGMRVSNCTFHRNYAYAGGGALHEAGSYLNPFPLFATDCAFTENSSGGWGGAVYSAGGRLTFLNCGFDDNAAGDGGAIGLFDGGNQPTVALLHCMFRRNTAGTLGGALWLMLPGYPPQVPPADVIGCVFVANSAADGGAAYLEAGGDTGLDMTRVSDSTFFANVASGAGGAIRSLGANSIANSVFWANVDSGGMNAAAQIHSSGAAPAVNYSVVQGGWPGGIGIINADPLFRRNPSAGADGWGDNPATPTIDEGANDDFGDLSLLGESPAIDAGDNAAVPADAADLDGDGNDAEPTPLDLAGRSRFAENFCTPNTGSGTPPIVDMGAYEYPEAATAQPILYVDADAAGANDGSSWTNALTSLRDALCAAGSGGAVVEVWVADGEYRPSAIGSRTTSFELANGVTLYGGFAGGEISLLERDPPANPTILSGDLLGNDDEDDFPDGPTYADNSYHVVTDNPSVAAAVLDGLTISGGNANGGNGGGLLVNHTGGVDPLIRNCTFTLNSASGVDGGGGLYKRNSPLAGSQIISNCTFHKNSAGVGGAISAWGQFDSPLSLLVTDCVFTENSATYPAGLGGGAAHLTSGTNVFLNCRFDDNAASGYGGAIACPGYGSEPTVSLFNCTFRRNTAASRGGALWLADPGSISVQVPSAYLVGCAFVANSAPDGGAAHIEIAEGDDSPPINVINCTFTANAAGNSGGGIYSVGVGYLGAQNSVSNSVFWANRDSGGMGESAQIHVASGAPTVNYSVVQGGWSGAGSGNVNADPLFVRDPDPGPDGLWNGINDDFGDLRLAAGSPAIDAGNNTLVVADLGDLDCDGNPLEVVPLDIDGGPRFIDNAGTVDTGVSGNGYTQIVDMGAHESGAASLDRLYVSASATGQNNGASWVDAHVELRDALDIVAANECFAVEVWVAAGTYRPAPPGGSREASFQLVDGVSVFGGFARFETSSDQRNPAVNLTVLSGDLAGNDTGGPTDPSRSENSFRVVTGTGTGPTALLDGFTITGGNAESPRTGGGLITQAGGPTLRDCMITGNTASCSDQLDSSGGVLTAEGLTLDLGAGGAGFDQSIIDVQGMLAAQGGEFDVFGTTLTGPGTLQLASGATMNVRNTSPCGAQTATRSAGPLAATSIYQPQVSGPPAVPARWEINTNGLSDVVISGATRTWVIAPTGLSAPATLTWTGNFIEEDRSSGGRAEALLHEHGALTVSGTVYEGANPLFTGTLLTAKVGEFHVQESATTANLLTFVEPPLLTLTGGYLVENDQGLILAGNQKLTLTGASVQQDGGAWSTFATTSTLALTGPAQLALEPANPPQTAMIVRSAIRGTGNIDIEFGGALILEEDASLNLSGLPDEVCVTTDVPGAPPGGTVSVNGSLIVRDTARVHNTQVDVNLADFGDGSAIVHNDLSLVEGSTGFGGEFFASGSATISCNRVTAYGDRIMDLDPDPDDGEAPILINNQFFVIISQGVDLEQGELFELRATDHDCADSNGCASGAFQLASGSGYDDTWTLEELEILPGAKVNLTNRAGFDFAPADPVPETMYVKNLVLGDGAVLNTGLQRLYYQNLTLGTGAQVLDIPMLGFSLKIIAMEDDVEFDVRVRTRTRDPADVQPLIPPFKEGSITRVEGLIPAASSNGVMDMRTQADGQLSASSVAARGSFARAGEDEIVVAFDYMFVEDPAAELIVYLSQTPDPSPAGCDSNGCCDAERCEIARVYVPPAGRDGAAVGLGGTGDFAAFYGEFPRGSLNFKRGTYVELELRGADARVWIDEWDPRIRCSGCADLNGTGGPEGEDYLLLLASFGLDIDANTRAETDQQENADCFDSVLGGDRYVDTGDLLAWDTFLDEDALNACGTGVRSEPRGLPPRSNGMGIRYQGNREQSYADSGDGSDTKSAGINPAARSVGDLLVAGKPNGAGLQDDYLYPIDTDGACPGGSPQPAAAGAGTRGHGRLVTAPDGTLYQLHATGGVLPVAGGPALVAPATNLTPTSNSSLRVTVGVNDFGGGEFLGLPLADAAFDPTNANELYVVPVLVTPFGGDTCDRYKAAAKLVLSGGNYTVERLYAVPAANRTPPCDFPPQLDQGEFREVEVSTDGTKVFIASARADNDNDWLLVFTESSGALATSALIGEVPPEGMMPVGLTVAAPLAMLASRVAGSPYLYLAAGVNAAPSETGGAQSVARTRVFRFNVSSGVAFAGALDISNPECVNPYDTLGCTSTLTALAENPNDGTLYALGFTAPRFDVDYPYNSPPFGGPNPNQIVIFTTPTLATIPPGTTWSMTVPPAPPAAAQATADLVTCADLALPISLAWNAASCGTVGDMDGDGDVQLDDWSDFAGCLTGPMGSLAAGCVCADLDADTDADLANVAAFQAAF